MGPGQGIPRAARPGHDVHGLRLGDDDALPRHRLRQVRHHLDGLRQAGLRRRPAHRPRRGQGEAAGERAHAHHRGGLVREPGRPDDRHRHGERSRVVKRSTERILTTHTGSLPRPPDLTAMLESMDAGGALDPAAFDGRVRRAVADIVRQQVDAGVDIVNDGEQGKVGYSTYVRHRLTGFGGQSRVPMRADWADFPEAAERQGMGRQSTIARPACNGPIAWKDMAAVQKDIAHLKAALSGVQPAEVFMTAASPGVIAHFLRNEYYPSREAYLARLADVMKEEYDA